MPSTDLLIRQADPADSAALSELICDNAENLLKSHYSDIQWESFVTFYTPEAMAEKFSVLTIFCAEINGVIVGTIALRNDFVVGFYTKASYVGRGIGTSLIKHVEKYAAGAGVKKLQLSSSPVALSFYLKNGWVKIKDIIANYGGVDFDETLMEKDISHLSK